MVRGTSAKPNIIATLPRREAANSRSRVKYPAIVSPMTAELPIVASTISARSDENAVAFGRLGYAAFNNTRFLFTRCLSGIYAKTRAPPPAVNVLSTALTGH
jgi:hypothetical protein